MIKTLYNNVSHKLSSNTAFSDFKGCLKLTNSERILHHGNGYMLQNIDWFSDWLDLSDREHVEMQNKFKNTLCLSPFHCKQHKKMKKIFFQNSKTSIKLSKEITHSTTKRVKFQHTRLLFHFCLPHQYEKTPTTIHDRTTLACQLQLHLGHKSRSSTNSARACSGNQSATWNLQ